MLTISSGHSADYLTGAVAAGRENYYTGAVAAGEPPGRWYGAGADQLGLTGLVDSQDMTALYEHFLDPRDPAFNDPSKWTDPDAATLGHTGRAYASEDEVYERLLNAEPDADPERRAELRTEAGKRARRNVSFLDATFSVQKSVTVLHTAFEAQEVSARNEGDAETAQAWQTHREAVEAAIWAGNRAALDYLAEHAGYSRVGHHGGAAGRFVDAHDWVVASFFQHDSRDHDPQLHIHNAILNRVQGSDGQWRTLDGRALYAHRGAAAAVGERTMEEHLTRALGVRFATRPDGKAREVVGIPQAVMDLFSSRRRSITAKTRDMVTAFETKFGRGPNSLELDRLQRQATFATRKAKSHDGETFGQRLERWNRELRTEVAGGLAAVADHVLTLAGKRPEPERWSRSEVIATALADVQAKKAAWTAPDLTRAISDALPDHLGTQTGDDIARLLDGLTVEALTLAVPLDAARPGEDALPDGLRLADGRSAYDAPGRRLYATPDHIHTERLLAASTTKRGAPALGQSAASGFVSALAECGIELGVDQAAAVRGVLTSGTAVESLVGPAGTGKSFVVGALAKAWQDPALWGGTERRVVGLATSQIATEVLTGEGLTASNVTRWLAAQERLAENGPVASIQDTGWRLRPGDLVVVDESAMTNTADLAAIHRHATAAGAKLLLTGDHRQLAAVGAGGGMDLVANSGAAYELTEARRFAASWERAASLKLREGDSSVLGEYHKHGRLLDGGTIEETERTAARAWLADTLAGKHSLLITDTNEQAARLSASLRADLVRLGRVAEDGVPLGLQGTWAGVGDLVQARRNGWHLAGVHGNRRGPINREQYRVLETREDGGLVVAPIHGRTPEGEQLGEAMTLPGDYVGEHVALGYASTVHAAQGLTVDTSHTIATSATGPAALYVGLSRGRHGNTAHVVTRAISADAPTGAVAEAVHRSPLSVLSATLDAANVSAGCDPAETSATSTAEKSAADAESIRTPAELLADAAELATAGRAVNWLDAMVDSGHLSEGQRTRLAAEDGAATLTRLLRRVELAGHDPQTVLQEAVTRRPLGDARQLSSVLHYRITGSVSLDPVPTDTYASWVPRVDDPQWTSYLHTLAATADARRVELGEDVTANPPQWAIENLGPVPESHADRAEWTARAGIVAAHRELTGHDDPQTALGGVPKAGQVTEYASWRSAWRALGRPEADRDEAEMSDGQLHLRVRAYERELNWAPVYVAQELAGTTQTADRHRQDAALRAAEAQATTDAETRVRLEREAADAAALADALDARARELETADTARAEWFAHTAETRAAADRAKAELTARNANRDEPAPLDDRVTAEEWLQAHTEATAAEDPHRDITTEHDLAHVVADHDADLQAAEAPVAEDPAEPTSSAGEPDLAQERGEGKDTDPTRQHERTDPANEREPVGRVEEPPADAAETAVPDIRQTSEPDRRPPEEADQIRVPTAAETAATIERAQRALTEIRQRQETDARRETEETRPSFIRLVRSCSVVDVGEEFA